MAVTDIDVPTFHTLVGDDDLPLSITTSDTGIVVVMSLSGTIKVLRRIGVTFVVIPGIGELSRTSSRMNKVVLSANGNVLAAASYDNIIVFNAVYVDGELERYESLQQIEESLPCDLCISPSGNTIVRNNALSHIFVHQRDEDGYNYIRIPMDAYMIGKIKLLDDDVLVGVNARLKMWERDENGIFVQTQKLSIYNPENLRYCGESIDIMGNKCVIGTNVGHMCFLSRIEGKYEVNYTDMEAHTSSVLSVCFVPNGNVVSGCTDGSIKVWCPIVDMYVQLRHFHGIHDGQPVNAVAVTANGLLLSGGDDRKLRICGEALIADEAD